MAVLIIHGGAGNVHTQDKEIIHQELKRIYEDSFLYLKNHSAVEAVIYAVSLLEDSPYFNAGTGSKLQQDGKARMSASLMDGKTQRFSAVLNIEDVKNPIQVAAHLQESTDSVLSGQFATAFSREKGFLFYDPITPRQREVRLQKKKSLPVGTVGAVALDDKGHLAAATSTGGKGFEKLGRVSDSAMPAGNYANQKAAVSCTGIGEHIINESLASRIVTRVIDGMTLEDAFQKSFKEVKAHQYQIGAIGIDSEGNVSFDYSTPTMSYAYQDLDGNLIIYPSS